MMDWTTDSIDRWQQKHPNKRLLLSDAELRATYLGDAHLGGADLRDTGDDTMNELLAPIVGARLPQRRVRIEVAVSTKGVHTYSCTVESVDGGQAPQVPHITDETLKESDRLVALLDARYPAEKP